MQPNEICGTLTKPNGDPLFEYTVYLTSNGQIVKQDLSDADGWYSFMFVQPGQYVVEAFPRDPGTYFDPTSRQAVMSPAGTGVGGLDFVLREGGRFDVTVPVVDEGGNGLPDVQVWLENRAGGSAQTTTGADGKAHFAEVQSGKLFAVAGPPGAAEGWYWNPEFLFFDLTDADTTSDRIVGRRTPWP